MDFKVSLVKQPVFNVRSDNIVKIEPPQESVTVKSAEAKQEIIARDKLFNKVVVENWRLQDKNVTPLEQEQVITADNGYDALRTVVVAEMPAQPSGEIELTKNGTYDVKNYATAVVNVGEEKDVNFYDYDGTLVASYTIEQAKTLSQLPPPPDHSQDEVPLTFQEWNYTLEEINALDHIADVGANYITTDGKTYAFFTLNKATGLTPKLTGYFNRVSISYDLYKLPENTLIDTYSNSSLSGSQTISLQNIVEYGNYKLVITLTETGTGSYFGGYNDLITSDITSNCPITRLYCGKLIVALNVRGYMFEKCAISTSIRNYTIINLKCVVIPRIESPNSETFINCQIVCTNPISNINQFFVYGKINRLALYHQSSSVSNTSIKELYLSPTMTRVGNLNGNSLLQNIILPPYVTTTANYMLSPGTSVYGSLQKAIFLGDITSFHGYTFGDAQKQLSLRLIDLSHCSSVPSLSSATLPRNIALKIKVPDALYDDFIVATNWVTYANNIVKASEYVEE